MGNCIGLWMKQRHPSWGSNKYLIEGKALSLRSAFFWSFFKVVSVDYKPFNQFMDKNDRLPYTGNHL